MKAFAQWYFEWPWVLMVVWGFVVGWWAAEQKSRKSRRRFLYIFVAIQCLFSGALIYFNHTP